MERRVASFMASMRARSKRMSASRNCPASPRNLAMMMQDLMTPFCSSRRVASLLFASCMKSSSTRPSESVKYARSVAQSPPPDASDVSAGAAPSLVAKNSAIRFCTCERCSPETMYRRSIASLRAAWARPRTPLEVHPSVSWSAPQMRFHASESPRSVTLRRVLSSACERSRGSSTRIDNVSCTRSRARLASSSPSRFSQSWSMPAKRDSCMSTRTRYLKFMSLTLSECSSGEAFGMKSPDGSAKVRPRVPNAE
mmetsp:Transcript_24931/g.59431  ORF Transcript_24931/g.59431 Transcript_24931/m.59431 type:complete len:254 (-) Transcript_24931:363-1124(-)